MKLICETLKLIHFSNGMHLVLFIMRYTIFKWAGSWS